jgi:hypothetical protein
LSEAQQIDIIKKIETPDLPPNDTHIMEGNPFILLRNIGTRLGFIKGRRCHAIQMKNRTVVFQFKNGETMALKKTPIEKASYGMKFIGRQSLLRPIFEGTMSRSQGMTLQRVVIGYRMKFCEHGQLYVDLSGVKSPGDLCMLPPDDMDDFNTRPAVDLDVVQILETMQSSRPLPITQISPGDNVESGIASNNPSDVPLSDEFPCRDEYFDAPEDQIRCVPSLDHDAVETFDPYPAEILVNV